MNNIAVVREDTESAIYWDKAAVEADQSRSNSSIDHAECLYKLKEGDRFKELGFKSMGEYCFERFAKSKQWCDKLVSIHQKFVIELGKSKQDLKEVGFGKIGKLVSIVDIDNVDTILEDAKKMSQKEIDTKIKELKGLAPNETKEEDGDVSLRFKVPKAVADNINTHLDIAKEEYCEGRDLQPAKVPDGLALELMAVNYGLSRDITGNLDETLNRLFKELELKYQISIQWTKEAQDEIE